MDKSPERRTGGGRRYAIDVPLTGEEIENIAGHLLHEIMTLAELPRWVDKFNREGPPILKIACLEAALVHARTLIEFVGGRQRQGKDITPGHFVSGWDPAIQLNEKYLEKIDQYLAHLSLARTKLETETKWNLTEMVGDIMQALRPFADRMETEGSPYAAEIGQAIGNAGEERANHPIVATTTNTNVVVVSQSWVPSEATDKSE